MRLPLALATLSSLVTANAVSQHAPLKPRIIVLTDITQASWEPDDMQSMVHLFASADLFEIEALIATSGWSIPPEPLGPNHIRDVIESYRSDLPNLMKRSNQSAFHKYEDKQRIGYWPSPEYLESIIRNGYPERGIDSIGDGKDTDGSNFIIGLVDQADERPIYVGVWGGANVLAQSIWDVRRTRSEAELSAFLSKLRVYAITDQDRDQGAPYTNSSQFWIRKTFPELFYISSESAWVAYGRTIRDTYWDSHYVTEIQGKGALGKKYPKWRYIAEGDSPCFAYVWPGLNDPEDPRQSSFAGKFSWELTPDNVTTTWTDTSPQTAAWSKESVTSLLPYHINDFIARMDWAANGVGNRNPVAVLQGKAGFSPVVLKACPGDVVRLSADGSKDEDGDSLTFMWYHDDGAGGYHGDLSLEGKDTPNVSLRIPRNASRTKIHIISRVVDNGTPPLASFRRAIISVN
ncbi:unnamed protein product [Clonostachys byssicola]|uniref:DUF1593-domain-containing protein n=1 Tax=Clonostachys byssicola TaxID=160290 RepID=A0A9N9UAG1_9HYPO|nr:unnamed protein product [Clonostachys byssicola]